MHVMQLFPSCRAKDNDFIALGMSVVDQKHVIPDSIYNFQNIEISIVAIFLWLWVFLISAELQQTPQSERFSDFFFIKVYNRW